MGYSSISKAYKVYHPQIRKMTITRDVRFNKDEQWDQEDLRRTNRVLLKLKDNSIGEETTDQWQNKLEDDLLIRGTRPLSDIYQRCNVAICESAGREKLLRPKMEKSNGGGDVSDPEE